MPKKKKPSEPAHIVIDELAENAQDNIAEATEFLLAMGVIDHGFHDGLIQGYLMSAWELLEKARNRLKEDIEKRPAELAERLEKTRAACIKQWVEDGILPAEKTD